jgi:hypothetical protein
MKIDKKTKMKEWPKVDFLLSLSKMDFFKELEAFEVPTKINEIDVKEQSDVTLGDMLALLEIKDDKDLFQATSKAFLGVDFKDKLPMIDFMRLVIYAKDTALKAAKRFEETKTEFTQEDRKVGLDKVSFPEYRMLEQYRSAHGLKDANEVYNISWWMVYLYFKKIKEDYEIDKNREAIRK